MSQDLIKKTIYLDAELINSIDELARKKDWMFSKMCYVLLQQAVKEKNRKKKAATEESNS